MLTIEGTGEGIAREAAEKTCCKKAKNSLMIGMAMAAVTGNSMTTSNKNSWQDRRPISGEFHINTRPDKKAKRKIKQASRRKNRKT